jgi:hypothetical protein
VDWHAHSRAGWEDLHSFLTCDFSVHCLILSNTSPMSLCCTGVVREGQRLGVALSQLKNNGETAAYFVARYSVHLLAALSSWQAPGGSLQLMFSSVEMSYLAYSI